MKKYSGKDKLISASGMLLAVFFISKIVFIMSFGFEQGEGKAAIEYKIDTQRWH